jgi:hypothetical protein
VSEQLVGAVDYVNYHFVEVLVGPDSQDAVTNLLTSNVIASSLP